MAANWTITSAGAAALAAAHAGGTSFAIDRVELGQAQYTPTGSETAIRTPFSPVRQFTNPQGYLNQDQVSLIFEDDSAAAYSVGEVGIFSGTTLYAISSQPGSPLFAKQADIDLQLAAFLTVSGEEIAAITFSAPPPVRVATETVEGIVRLATSAEVTARTGNGVIRARDLPGDALPSAGSGHNGQLLQVVAGAWARVTGLAASSITSGTLHVDRIPSLNASKIGAGTLATARIPNLSAAKITSGTLSASRVGNLPASKITSGTLSSSRIPALSVGHIPNLPASRITSGTLSSSRIPALSVGHIPNLPASRITSGTLSSARLDTASGANLNTATSTTQLATPKALADSDYRRVVKLTQAAYNALSSAAKSDSKILYAIKD